MSEFLSMGGYAQFVWPCYGLTALVFWLNWYLPYRQHRQLMRQLQRRYRAKTGKEYDTGS